MSTATQSDSLPHARELIAAIGKATGDAPLPLALHEPLLTGNEAKFVQSCIDENWVSSVGAFVDRFEKDLAETCGAHYAVAAVNGTCALHAALAVMGVKAGDEVLVPSLTFVATANAVMHAGATPHFVEAEEDSLGIDPAALGQYLKRTATRTSGGTVNKHTGKPIRALMPVHVFGHPCRIGELNALAEEWGLQMLEDATEALGSTYSGKKIGSEYTAVFSFNGNKIITTGGGGAIVTQDEALFVRLKHLTSTGKQPHAWAFNHDAVAWNYRMPNINAALGCAQLEQLPHWIAAKRALAERYRLALATLPGLRFLNEPKDTRSNYWLATLITHKADPIWLEATLKMLHEAKILCRPLWTPLHKLPMYKDCPRADLTLTENLSQRILSLPSSPKLGLPYI